MRRGQAPLVQKCSGGACLRLCKISFSISKFTMARFSLEKWIVIITVITASLLQLIDTSIVNVTLTQMMGNLGASLGDISWVVTGYAAANVIMITLSGWLSAKFG